MDYICNQNNNKPRKPFFKTSIYLFSFFLWLNLSTYDFYTFLYTSQHAAKMDYYRSEVICMLWGSYEGEGPSGQLSGMVAVYMLPKWVKEPCCVGWSLAEGRQVAAISTWREGTPQL